MLVLLLLLVLTSQTAGMSRIKSMSNRLSMSKRLEGSPHREPEDSALWT